MLTATTESLLEYSAILANYWVSRRRAHVIDTLRKHDQPEFLAANITYNLHTRIGIDVGKFLQAIEPLYRERSGEIIEMTLQDRAALAMQEEIFLETWTAGDYFDVVTALNSHPRGIYLSAWLADRIGDGFDGEAVKLLSKILLGASEPNQSRELVVA